MAYAKPFSYCLKMRIEPQWGEIIKRVVGLKNAQEQTDFGNKLREYRQTDRMINRRYDFTEFFDTSTGLTLKYQRVHLDDKTYSNFVDEFGDAGYLLGRDSSLMPDDQREKYQIKISEHSIQTECFDNNTGQLVSWSGDVLFEFPIDPILEFGVALQLQFPDDLTTNNILKWPDKIETALRSKGTKYETIFDFTPSERNLEKENREFFLRYGRPKLATLKSWPTPYFEGPCCYYSVELQVFTPETAKRKSRLAFSHLTAESILGD